jgi:hypothetical protein
MGLAGVVNSRVPRYVMLVHSTVRRLEIARARPSAAQDPAAEGMRAGRLLVFR